LEWDYTTYPKGYFDIIWASPPCNSFSVLQNAIKTKEDIYKNIVENGLPCLRKTEKIIDYFEPKYYFIENPQTGRMKEFITRPFYDVDYCMYSDWGYKKRTRIWTNLTDFEAKLCNKECGNMVQIGKKNVHKTNCGNSNQSKLTKTSTSLYERYRIPPNLLESLFTTI
jgi:hypothetical protein